MTQSSKTCLSQHLSERHCQTDIYGNSLVLNEEDRVVTFLLWNFSGQLVGYQQYRPDNHEKAVKNHPDKRYYLLLGDEGGEIQNKSKRRLGVFGIETLKRFPLGPILLVEGIFDAVRLHSAGYAALALLSANPKKTKPWLSLINRTKIAICDGDAEGRNLAKYGDDSIYLDKELDVGDLTDFEFKELQKQIEICYNSIKHSPGKSSQNKSEN